MPQSIKKDFSKLLMDEWSSLFLRKLKNMLIKGNVKHKVMRASNTIIDLVWKLFICSV